jgi:signal transduction histidine kinase
MNIPNEPEKPILDKPEGDVKSFFVAMLTAILLFVSIFIFEIFLSRPRLNILLSSNKSLALSTFILLGVFITIESLSKLRPGIEKLTPIARRMGAMGFVFAFLHILAVIFLLGGTFTSTVLQKESLSINVAKIAVIFLVLVSLSFAKTLSKKMGEKRRLFIQILGSLSLILILAHALLIIKPPYDKLGGSLSKTVGQTELIFIGIFVISSIFLYVLLYFLGKRTSLHIKLIAHTLLYFMVNALIIGSYLGISDAKRHHEETFRGNHYMSDYVRGYTQDKDTENTHSLTDSLSRSSDSGVKLFFLGPEKRVSHHPEKKEEDLVYQNFGDTNKTKYGEGWDLQYKKDGHLFLDSVISFGPEKGYLVVSTDYTKQNIDFRNQLIYASIFIVVIILTTIGMTLVFTRRNILDPIRRITQSSKKMSEGNFDTKISLKNNDEFTTLAEMLNTLSQRMQEQINALLKMDKLKNEFIAIASHNLRTPLTTLRGYLDMIDSEKSGKLNKKQKDMIQKAEKSTTALISLTEGLVSITSLETEGVKIEKDLLDLTKIIDVTLEAVSAKAKEKNIKIENKLGSGAIMTIGDEPKLKQAFLAVLENAVKFNKEGGKIKLEKIEDDTKQATIGRKEVIITITDTGIGISKSEKENVFQKFNRGTSTYTYEYEGVGLGLYIAKLIIQAHRGRIWFESTENKGTIFYISLTTTEQNFKKGK